MKRYLIFTLCALMGIFTACNDDDDIVGATISVGEITVAPKVTTAFIIATVNSNVSLGNVQVVADISEHDDFDDPLTWMMISNNKDEIYSASAKDLKPNTTYYVRIRIVGKLTTITSDIEEKFKTLTYTAPVVITGSVSDITYNSFTVSGEAISDNEVKITSRGFCYDTQKNPTITSQGILSSSNTDKFTCTITERTPSTTYYVRAFATNSVGTSYGDEIQVTTAPPTLPSIGISTTSNVDYTTATLSCSNINDGGSNIIERGVCYSESTNPTINDDKQVYYGTDNSFSVILTGLKDGTTYYARAYAINSVGVAYSKINLKFTTKKYGIFSVSDTRKVIFSPGNLQYQASTGKWRFAENQWDYVGNSSSGTVYENGVKCDNAKISATYDGWIDLFGWGTSGWNSGANAYQPYSTSTSDSDYYPGGSATNNLTGNYAKADWGVYNTIGTDPAGTWRTLTYEEWEYVFSSRSNANVLRGQAIVHDIKGYILLPDDWVVPSGISFTAGTGVGYTTNTYTNPQWDKMEQAGAVFLPAAGYRNGTSVHYVQSGGYYWSITANSTSYARFFYFYSSLAIMYSSYRSTGQSVRLALDLNKE